MKVISLLLGCCFWMKVGAQIWSNPITGTNISNSNPYTNGQTVGLNITVSGIGFNAGTGPASGNNGINKNNANDRMATDGYTAPATPVTSPQSNDYYYFSLTPNPGYWINFSSFVFSTSNSSTGPPNFVVRSSADNYSADLGNSPTISLSSFVHINSTITFRIYPYGATDNAGTFSINDFTFNGSVALPIQLSSFKVVLKNGKPLITWATYSETNNDHYTIQRSSDGQSFTDLATYNGIGKGASDHELSYAHIDQTPLPGKNYYRLKQVDLDGASSVFPIRSVFVPSRVIKVYPTYVKNELKMELPYKDTWRWSITDLSGHSCDEGYATSSGGIAILALNHLSNGFYVITLSSLEDKKSFKIIKL